MVPRTFEFQWFAPVDRPPFVFASGSLKGNIELLIPQCVGSDVDCIVCGQAFVCTCICCGVAVACSSLLEAGSCF